jgi:hypothetical protein
MLLIESGGVLGQLKKQSVHEPSIYYQYPVNKHGRLPSVNDLLKLYNYITS